MCYDCGGSSGIVVVDVAKRVNIWKCVGVGLIQYVSQPKQSKNAATRNYTNCVDFAVISRPAVLRQYGWT